MEIEAKLIEQISRFVAFVHYNDGRHFGYISFRDSAGFLGREEEYKTRIAEEARKELDIKSWSESWIGTGKIANCVKRAMNKSDNLVNKYSRIKFLNQLDPKHSDYRQEAERVLYDVYRSPLCDEATAFAEAVETFGAKYDTIAFLFYIKDDSRFLPISPEHFDKSFCCLGIDLKTSRCCSWDNYQSFVSYIQEIREVMQDMLPILGTVRLIDAHSFVWIIQQNRFISWLPDNSWNVQIEQAAEEYIQKKITGSGGRRTITTNAFVRSANVVKETRKRANGVCQYCNQPAPFLDKKGTPYLEVHHIVWLSLGGEDSTDNTVALCPNCHTKMHVLDKPEDIEKLKRVIDSSKKRS